MVALNHVSIPHASQVCYTVFGTVQFKRVKTNYKGPTKSVLVIRHVFLIRNCLLHVSTLVRLPNSAQKLVCIKQKFVLIVFVLTRF